MYYALDWRKHYGSCVLYGKPGHYCPEKLSKEQIVLSPQGFGPARNIIAFAGGDIACRAEFYAKATIKIKEKCNNLWVLLETNGYGLTTKNLDILQDAGLDSFWLDVKAFDKKDYKKLCGTSNDTVLKAPEEILKRDFVLEILTVYIPNFVELDQFKKIARLIVNLNDEIPFHILAFFPQYKLINYRAPTLDEMIETYRVVKDIGLKNVRLGNMGIFIKNEQDRARLMEEVGISSF